MSGKLVLSYVDYSKEDSAMGVHTATLTAGNFTAQMTLQDALRTAVEAVVIGNLYKAEYVAVVENIPKVYPSTKLAQVENKWLVSAVDNVTGFAVSFTIPCADLTYVDNNTDLMDLVTAGPGANLKAAIEDVVLSRAGNAVTVNEIRFVGRNA